MGFTYENQSTHTYLVYEATSEDVMDSMSLGMVTTNKIQGLAQTFYTQMNATKYIKYDISAKISLSDFFSSQVNKKKLLGVFNGIVDALLLAEEYMIDLNTILLDLSYIFVDVSSYEVSLICLPLETVVLQHMDLKMFFKSIMFSTQYDHTENVDHVAKLINYLNSIQSFSLCDFKKLLISLNDTSASTPTVTSTPKSKIEDSDQTTSTDKKPTSSGFPNRENEVPIIIEYAPPQEPKNNNKMTMLKLLMHYSKENVELYKNQKAAKKNELHKSVETPSSPQKNQPVQQEFAIPGQQTPLNREPIAFSQGTNSQSQVAQNAIPAKSGISESIQQMHESQIYRQPVKYPLRSQNDHLNFGQTVVLDGGNMGATTVLNSTVADQVRPHLVRMKNNEKIAISKPVFRIGKEKSYVDYFIGDNSAISRSHADIISRANEYYIKDTNSRNHTYVNGSMIVSNEEIKITHGTKIRLANEDFEFKLFE